MSCISCGEDVVENISLHVWITACARWPSRCNIIRIEFHCHLHVSKYTCPGLGAFCDWTVGHINRLVESWSLNQLPVVSFEFGHQVDITEHRLAVDHCEAYVSVNSFDKVPIRVLMEGIDYNQICVQSSIDGSYWIIPVVPQCRIFRNHCSKIVIWEVGVEIVAVPKICNFQLVKYILGTTWTPVRCKWDADASLVCSDNICRVTIKQEVG